MGPKFYVAFLTHEMRLIKLHISQTESPSNSSVITIMGTETYSVSCHMSLICALLENYFTTPEDTIMSKEGLIAASSATVQQ